MKKYLFFIVFISLLQAKAQTSVYHPFPDSNVVWGIRTGCVDNLCGDWAYIKNYYEGDTLINGLHYKIIFQQGLMMTNGSCCGIPTGAGSGYLREDTTARKVYWRDQSMNVDTLLYDFNVNIGDTLKGYFSNCPMGIVTVQSIDSIFIGTSYRKRINYDSLIFPCGAFSIIEGIGGTGGLTTCLYFFEMGSELTCFSENGNLLYLNSCNSDTIPCGDLTVGVNEFSQNAHCLVFPNPFHSVINIQSLQQNMPFKLYFYDVLGKVLLEKEITIELSAFDLSFLSEGVYFLKIERYNKLLEFKKIIKYE